MVELEIYAAGVRNLDTIMELDHAFGTVPNIRYKVDTNHDIVYMELEKPTPQLDDIRAVFEQLGLKPRFVGVIPPELRSKSRTQLLAK